LEVAESLTEVLLRTEDLTKDFGGVKAVNKLQFVLQEREVRCIIGPNGAGKTTFFDLISGFLTPTAGRIFFRRADITRLPPYARARLGIGRKFQIPSVYNTLTVSQNLVIPVQLALDGKTPLLAKVPDAVYSRVDEILTKIGLHERRNDPAASLSHGEKQWLELGLALANNPALLLLDEPTAGMSPEETKETAKLITNLSEGLSIAIIEHDIQFVKELGTKVTVMHHGNVLLEGTLDELQRDDRMSEIYFGKRRGVVRS